MTIVGTKICERRKLLGMTQEELASKMGYKSKSSINKIEMGINDITQTKVIKFAEVLDCTPSYLMGWEDNTEQSNITIKKTDKDMPEYTVYKEDDNYYIDPESRQIAQFLFDNPNYKVLFDAARKVKPEDIERVKQMIDLMSDK